ncbi:phage tail tape measure protein [Latilactobacillus curvatus]|uniref:phage tail tape measure protein n=1 Tax=Latilactobacillus curvatus TaxID=28038 RepID=UPI0020C748EC|nr:phage tail tape measure protein [Latilactobacillus curvatus]MCP8849189.1 phage tail tape measure protein [Latilactobacillus curvatus]
MAQSLGHLASTVSLNIDPFKSSSNALKAQIRANSSALKAQDAAFKSSGNNINNMKSVYSSMEQQMKNYNAQLARQKEAYDKLKGKTAETEAEQEKLTARQANAANQYNKTSANIEVLNGKMVAMQKQILTQNDGWIKASEKLSAFSDKTAQVSQKLSSVGRDMTTKVTLPIVAGLGYAAKSAVDFNSQISAIGPLLTNGGKITASVRKELDQMGNSSKTWAMQFGISTGKINDGMSEMVKRGYSAKQTMGAMPAVLNASKASGEDFNDVMSVSTSTLEQFGLKTESTSGMLKNTTRVTDSLTYVANATAAGFDTMGEAMTYVGPSAHAAGISLEETAAAIGVMSQKGIEGSVAGTALRGALTKLLNPSNKNRQGFKELGVSVDDFKKGTLTLPEILDKIKNNTEGWTDQQRASSIALAFGTEAQAGMNALISSGGDELRKYTKGAQEASGTTKQIADQLNNTQAAKVARFKESIHVLSIEVGEKLLPALLPLVEKATDMVQSFAKMDDATQQSIIKWAIFAATIGPVAGTMGKVGTVVSQGSSLFSIFAKKVGEANVASQLAAGGLGKLGPAALEGAAGTEALAGGATAATAALSPVGLAVLGTVAVVGAGVAIWELWGKKAYNSGQRAQRWGTDVGEAADKSLTKMQGFSTEVSASLEGFNGKTETTTKEVASNFNDMFSQMKKDSKDSLKQMKKDIDDLPGFAKASAEKELKARTTNNRKILDDAKSQNNLVQQVLKKHNGDVSKLSDDERTIVLNARTRINADEVKLLKISGSAKKSVIAALNGDINSMSKKQRGEAIDDLTKQFRSEEKVYQKQQGTIEKAYKNGSISAKAYKDDLKQLADMHEVQTDSMAASVFRLAKANGESKEQISNDLLSMGYTYEQAAKIVKDQSANMSKSTGLVAKDTAKMSKATEKANAQWNSLIFDPKTGELKTNAQEEVNKAAQSEEGWTNLKYDLKHANLSSNAKLMIGEAALANGKWEELTWKEQQAIVAVKGNKEMADIIQQFGIWDQFTPEQKEAILHGDASPIANLLLKGGQWNDLSLKEQQALVKDKATVPLVNILDKYGVWQGLSDEEKNAVLNTKGAPALADMVIKYGTWNDLPQKQKDLLINNTDARQKLIDAGILLDAYKTNNPASKPLQAHDGGLAGAVTAGNAQVDGFKTNNPPSKPLKAHDAGLGVAVTDADGKLIGFRQNNPESKGLKAHDAGLGGTVTAGNSRIDEFKRNDPGLKYLRAKDEASSNAAAAKRAVSSFGGNETITKTLNVVANIGKGVKDFLHLENGTTNAPGGPAIVNDQRGPNYQELIIPKGGTPFMFADRNAFVPHLKKGSTVIPANKTRRILEHVPKFANGTIGHNQTVNTLLRAKPMIEAQKQQSIINQTVQVSNFDNLESQLNKLDKLDTVVNVLGEILAKNPNIILDKKVVSTLVEPGVSKNQMQNNVLAERRVHSG